MRAIKKYLVNNEGEISDEVMSKLSTENRKVLEDYKMQTLIHCVLEKLKELLKGWPGTPKRKSRRFSRRLRRI